MERTLNKETDLCRVEIIDDPNKEKEFLDKIEKYCIPVPIITSIITKRYLGIEDVIVLTHNFRYEEIVASRIFKRYTLYKLINNKLSIFYMI